jgi:hypothetical protein
MTMITVRAEPIDRDIELLVRPDLSPKARSSMLARFAGEQLKEAQAINQRASGSVPRHETFVDGRANAPLESVRPDGKIVFEFALLLDLFAWIGAELVQHSPVGPPPAPAYRENFVFFADGQQVPPGGKVPEAELYTFLNTVKYARKIEKGESAQAPDGVFHVVATLAQRRFGNIARVRFAYREFEGSRQPAIEITPGK